jgi:hypothetical protein
LGGTLFVLAHSRDLHFVINLFPSCLFPSILDDIHINDPLSIVSSTYEHFQTKLHVIRYFYSNLKMCKMVTLWPIS